MRRILRTYGAIALAFLIGFGASLALAQTFSSVQVLDGAAGKPSITFLNDTTAGLYRSGTGIVGVGTSMSLPNVQATITPGSQAVNTCAEQAFTLTGGAAGVVKVNDRVVLVSYPATGNATGYGGSRVSAADTIQQTVCNPTAGALTPAAGTFVYLVIRPQ